jgi:peptidoglycan/LPS O-acetylase OafA/YrhL
MSKSRRAVCAEDTAPVRDATLHGDGRAQRADLKPLTSLRFVAALLVFLDHAPPLRLWSENLMTLGAAGVTFFFILSGFILTYVYRDLAEQPTFERIRHFCLSRFSRIYPTHVVATILALGVLTFVGSSEPWLNDPAKRIPSLLAQFTLVQSWFPAVAIHYGVNTPSWSISDEVFFYVLFPFIVTVVATRVRHLTAMALTLWCVILGLAWIAPDQPDHWFHYNFPPTRLLDFTIGVTVGVLFLRRMDTCGTILEIAAIEGILASLLVEIIAPQLFHSTAIMVPAWAFLIYVMAHQRGKISRWLSYPVAVRLGEISFAFYLVHVSVIRSMPAAFFAARPALATVIALVTSLALAWAVHSFIEEPARRAIRRLAGGGRFGALQAAVD